MTEYVLLSVGHWRNSTSDSSVVENCDRLAKDVFVRVDVLIVGAAPGRPCVRNRVSTEDGRNQVVVDANASGGR